MTQQPGWHAVALAGGVETGTSMGTHLHGEEIVVWRDADGAAHAWEDRCPHRGMRLSMGFVRTDRIACLYHGWQYGTDGHCLYIPAHPEIQVPPSIVTWRHTCAEAMGMIWVHFGDAPDEPSIPVAAAGLDTVPVRSLYVDRPAEILAERFAAAKPTLFRPEIAANAANRAARREGLLVIHTLHGEDLLIGAVHPMDDGRSALHLVIVGDAKDYRGAGQLHFSRFAEMLRDHIELGEPMPAAEPVLA
jgi:nitrite reductase/ring-hydroxylating ferredoxin subunit